MSVLEDTESKYNILDKISQATVQITIKNGTLPTTLIMFDNKSFFYTIDNGMPRLGVSPMNITRQVNEKFKELLFACINECYNGLFDENWDSDKIKKKMSDLQHNMTAYARNLISEKKVTMNNGTLIEEANMPVFAKNVSCKVLYSEL